MPITATLRRTLLVGAFIGLFPLSAGALNPPTTPEPPPTGGGGGTLPPVSRVDVDGPFATTIDRNAGPTRSGWVVRPTNLGANGLQHPIFIWGPGAASRPSDYEDHLRRIASHGFVVYSEESSSQGTEMGRALDWLITQNGRVTSTYYQKLDTTRIALGGHSRGSIATFANGSDPRIATTIHVAGGSFDGNGPSSLHKPAAIVCAANDLLATGNCRRDYANSTVPTWFTIMRDSDHISAARDGLPIIVAWLRWHLGGETERRGMFIGPNCDFCGAGYETYYKNW